jgi:hypothetical protein
MILCAKYKISYSGTKEAKINRLRYFQELAVMVLDNFTPEGKLKDNLWRIKEIKPILKKNSIKHSWLRKKEKLELAKENFIGRLKYKPNWELILKL